MVQQEPSAFALPKKYWNRVVGETFDGWDEAQDVDDDDDQRTDEAAPHGQAPARSVDSSLKVRGVSRPLVALVDKI